MAGVGVSGRSAGTEGEGETSSAEVIAAGGGEVVSSMGALEDGGGAGSVEAIEGGADGSSPGIVGFCMSGCAIAESATDGSGGRAFLIGNTRGTAIQAAAAGTSNPSKSENRPLLVASIGRRVGGSSSQCGCVVSAVIAEGRLFGALSACRSWLVFGSRNISSQEGQTTCLPLKSPATRNTVRQPGQM
jgi:hypothetical protein